MLFASCGGKNETISDNVIECDGKTLRIIEDYAEEVAEILGEK